MSDGIQNIQETLRNIVTEYGAEILQDTNKLSAALSKTASAHETAGAILVQALDKGIGAYYTNSNNMPKERIISRTLDLLKPSFPDVQIQEVTSVLFHAMGWDTTIVKVYFAEYIKRMMPSKQVNCDTLKPPANDIVKKEERNRETAAQNDSGMPAESLMDLQVGAVKKRRPILLVIIVLILGGILVVLLLFWISSRKPAQEAGMVQFDLNQDGVVDSTDVAAILGISAKMGVNGESEVDEALIKQGDVNGDSLMDASDAAQILQYAAQAGVADAK